VQGRSRYVRRRRRCQKCDRGGDVLDRTKAAKRNLPDQRTALDARRNEKAARAPAAAPVRIDGYVLRSGGRPTLWVNGSVERSNLAAKSGSTLDHAEARDVIEDRQVRLKR